MTAMTTAVPKVWILPATGAGDNQQLRCLAEALGWPHDVKPGPDTLLGVLRDRLLLAGNRPLPAAKREWYQPPWPDLLLLCGGRAVVDARRIKTASGGRTRLVCLGRPWADLDHFDLVVTTPQYRLPTRPNVLENAMPLQPAWRARVDAGPWSQRLAQLPRPWLLALLGGVSGSYRFPVATGRELGRQLAAAARHSGGSVLVSSSARTPVAAMDALVAELDVPAHCYRWRPDDADNPLPAWLQLADCLLVTGDSAAMVADACSSGRPVAVFEPPPRWHTRLLTGKEGGREAGPWGRSLQRWRDQLIARGCWFPARDLARYRRVLQEQGFIEPWEPAFASSTGSLRPQADNDALERTVARVRALFD